MQRRLIGSALAVVLMLINTAVAQEGALSKLYGQGVHQYFAGDYAAAGRSLSRAIDSGSEDPRCYYFRGLARLRLGQTDEARGDLEHGARLESRGADRYYNVGQALERVQGRARLTVERYRTAGRVDAAAEARRVRQLRYDRIRDNEAEVLSRPAPDMLVPLPEGTAVEDTPPPGDATGLDAPEGVAAPVIDNSADPFAGGAPFEAPAAPGAVDETSSTVEAVEAIDTTGAEVPAEKLQGVLSRALLRALAGGEESSAPLTDGPPDLPPPPDDDPFNLGDDPTIEADSPDADLSDPNNPFGDDAVIDDAPEDMPPADEPAESPPDPSDPFAPQDP